MNKFVFYLLSLMILSSCNSKNSESNKLLLDSPIFENDGKYLIIPLLYGCDGCVKKTYEFVESNHASIKNKNDFYVVWTQLKNKRQIERDYDEKFLENFIIDSLNVLNSEIDSYPVLFEVESGYINNQITLSPDNLNSELKNLKDHLIE
ncbi:hypothetical protein QYS49_16235 [Marivirga salinae]|uniref:Uncharacterized protein n=1 Tax=Marivirga salinarum TaxID=3059078 RepID=A0AA49JB45_9BACT|nr:hypothetical protein [Marivirga sp. BDSF4-3]WKK73507.2 hypothetical protein QYS49_16235 [Marivirga sp. BDSF4-3]